MTTRSAKLPTDHYLKLHAHAFPAGVSTQALPIFGGVNDKLSKLLVAYYGPEKQPRAKKAITLRKFSWEG